MKQDTKETTPTTPSGEQVGSTALFAGVNPTAWYCDTTNGYGERSRLYTEDAGTLGLRKPLYSREDVLKILAANITQVETLTS
tara:strand:- start:21 stop:269 length:249 start_codon:yes stop_codon:yes gene_type:complete